jgi:hypothetical protein
MIAKAIRAREICPPGYQYGSRIEDNPKVKFDQEFAEYLTKFAEFEKLSKIHIYDAAEVDILNFRYHCLFASDLLCLGQQLYISAEVQHLDKQEVGPALVIIQEKINSLIHLIQEWHSPIGSLHNDPPSLKEAIEQLSRGQAAEMEF